MRRREFISGAVMLGWPAASYAQTASHVIGFVNSASAEGYSSMADAFKEGLAAAGYREGANVRIEYRWADNRYDRIPGLVTDVVARQVDVIVANGPVIAAVKAATSTIPIVFTSGEDPVRLGLVERLNRPGGNVTGAIVLSAEVGSKRLQLLHELLPQAKTIAVLVNLDFGPSGQFQADVESAAKTLGLSVQFFPASTEVEVQRAFERLAEVRGEAILVGPGPFLDSRRNLLVALATKASIPAAYETRATAMAGGLISYGGRVSDMYRQAGVYAGRILNGDKPGELPVFLATRLELVINLRTARSLGLDVPAAILARADEVIE